MGGASQRGEHEYTLRQMDLFMPVTLEDVYQRLNFMDPTVKGRTGINRWGGSGDIGGSPRDSGTRLSPEQIVSACRDVIEKRSDIRHVKRFLTSAAFALLVVGRCYCHGAELASTQLVRVGHGQCLCANPDVRIPPGHVGLFHDYADCRGLASAMAIRYHAAHRQGLVAHFAVCHSLRAYR